jgi:hypothetical protein
MIEITDSISKILSRDSQHGYAILTYCDISLEFTNQTLHDHLQIMIHKFPVLKQYIIEKNSDLFLEDDTEFKIENHYQMIYDTFDHFDSYIDTILNSDFKTKSKWSFHYLADKESNKYRVYFKIDHSYADGYKIIEMLMSPLKSTYTPIQFKRSTTSIWDTIYYIIIGTIVLLFSLCKRLLESFFSISTPINVQKTDYIRCKPLSLSDIKHVTQKHHITVNDFLYALLVKTDSLYHTHKRDIVTISPVNISGLKHLNNIAPIVNKISNTIDNKDLFHTVHETFNSYKYSLYIPIISFVLRYIIGLLPLHIQSNVYDSLVHRCDYIYTNIIGPTYDMVEDIHFLTLAKNNEIVFNIISSNDRINIICSFKEGIIQDKSRFEKCIYMAYENLTKTEA